MPRFLFYRRLTGGHRKTLAVLSLPSLKIAERKARTRWPWWGGSVGIQQLPEAPPRQNPRPPAATDVNAELAALALSFQREMCPESEPPCTSPQSGGSACTHDERPQAELPTAHQELRLS